MEVFTDRVELFFVCSVLFIYFFSFEMRLFKKFCLVLTRAHFMAHNPLDLYSDRAGIFSIQSFSLFFPFFPFFFFFFDVYMSEVETQLALQKSKKNQRYKDQ